MVNHPGTQHDIERSIRKGESLDHPELEVDRKTTLSRFATGIGDHLPGWVNATYAACYAHALTGDQRQRSGAASYIQHCLSWPQSGQVGDHLPKLLLPTPCKECHDNTVIDPGPADDGPSRLGSRRSCWFTATLALTSEKRSYGEADSRDDACESSHTQDEHHYPGMIHRSYTFPS